MSKPKAKMTMVQFASRDRNFLSDKYIKEVQTDIPFDMSLVSSINSKKVDVHRFVVMMFSKHIRNLFKDGGNSYKNGHVIIPVNVPYPILLKIIELFYDCQAKIPTNSVPDMHKALHILQVDNVMDFIGQMPPPIVPNPGTRSMPITVQPFNRRQTMAYMQPINDLKRRRSNVVPIQAPMARPLVAPIKQQPIFEQARIKPLSVPVAAVRKHLGSGPITHGEIGSTSASASEHSKNKVLDESNKLLFEKIENPNDGDTNKENERPELNLEYDISKDEIFHDFFTDLEYD